MASKANLDVSEKLDITVRRGDSFDLSINIKDNDGNNLALETNNYEFTIQVKNPVVSKSLRRTAPVQKVAPQKTLVAASSLTQSETQNVPKNKEADSPIFEFVDRDDNGNVTLRASAANTATLPVGNFVYDLQYKFTSGSFDNVTTILKGNFIVKEDISTTV